MMRLLITGASGQLGRALAEAAAGRFETAGADLPETDLTDAATVERLLAETHPQAVINAAAFTRVDDCESMPEAAEAGNTAIPRILAQAAHRHGAFLAHVSTDYVFDGRRPPPEPYIESDEPGPVTVYGRTKLAGERAVFEAGGRAAVVRTAWLYGRHGHNFLKTILGRALRAPGAPMHVVNDQHGCPTSAATLARQLLRLVEAGCPGLFHAVGEGHTTWYGLAVRFLARLGVPNAIEPCTSEAYPTPAQRPRNSILANARLHAERLCLMRHWTEDLDAFASEHGDALRREAEERQ